MSKKVISLLLCLALALGLFTVSFAADSAITATATVTELEQDGTTVVSVTLKAAEAVKSIGVKVEFDSEVLELTEATPKTANAQISKYDTEKNNYAAMLSSAEAYDGDILSLNFKVIKAAYGKNTSTITLTPTLKNGSKTIAADPVTVDLTIDGGEAPHVHSAVKTEAKAATCEAAGNTAYWYCEGCGQYFSDEACTKPIAQADTVVAALGHKYGEPTYEWSADNKSVTATAVCANDASHKVTETVETTVDEKEATCTEPGGETFTATFTKEQFTTQTKAADPDAHPALGHSLTKTDAKDADCENDGNIAYWTCERCKKIFSDAEGKTAITEADTVVPATGHTFEGEPVFTWASDNKSAVATFHCTTCNKDVDVDAEMSEDGNIVTATAVDGDKEYTDIKHVDSATATVAAKNEAGEEVKITEGTSDDIPDANLLTPAKASDVTKTDANVEDTDATLLKVVWQKELTAPAGTTGKLTMTFALDSIGKDEKLLVYHHNGTAWEILAEGELGAKEVEATFTSLSPVALVVMSTAVPATGDASNVLFWTVAMLSAAVACAFVVTSRKRGKHQA